MSALSLGLQFSNKPFGSQKALPSSPRRPLAGDLWVCKCLFLSFQRGEQSVSKCMICQVVVTPGTTVQVTSHERSVVPGVSRSLKTLQGLSQSGYGVDSPHDQIGSDNDANVFHNMG